MEQNSPGPEALTESSPEDDLGPFYYTRGGAATLMGISEDALSARIAEGQLLELPCDDDTTLLPSWQFEEDMQPKPWVGSVISILSQSKAGSMTMAAWIKGFEKVCLDGTSVDEWLMGGGDLDYMLAEARRDAYNWTH